MLSSVPLAIWEAHYEQEEVLKRLQEAEGNLAYCLCVFGDTIANREKYKDLDGLDAVRFYFIQKYRWLPRDVRAMSYEDMRFVLSQEMAGWTLPKAARI